MVGAQYGLRSTLNFISQSDYNVGSAMLNQSEDVNKLYNQVKEELKSGNLRTEMEQEGYSNKDIKKASSIATRLLKGEVISDDEISFIESDYNRTKLFYQNVGATPSNLQSAAKAYYVNEYGAETAQADASDVAQSMDNVAQNTDNVAQPIAAAETVQPQNVAQTTENTGNESNTKREQASVGESAKTVKASDVNEGYSSASEKAIYDLAASYGNETAEQLILAHYNGKDANSSFIRILNSLGVNGEETAQYAFLVGKTEKERANKPSDYSYANEGATQKPKQKGSFTDESGIEEKERTEEHNAANVFQKKLSEKLGLKGKKVAHIEGNANGAFCANLGHHS